MLNAHRYAVILAGGKGKRLWPLSRHAFPKQLIPFVNNKTLLDLALERANALTSSSRCGLITVENYLPLMKELSRDKLGFTLSEPYQRNTAAAITLAAFILHKNDPNAVIFFMPSDHCITDTAQFIHVAQMAIDHASNHDHLVLLGVQPTHAATEYGYIEYTPTDSGSKEPVHVIQFYEKPSSDRAEYYYKSGNMVWNSGMLCAKASTVLDAVRIYAPHVYNAIESYHERGDVSGYELLSDRSFDTEVLEYAQNTVLFSADFGWSDVGSLTAFLELHAELIDNAMIEVSANNNLVYNATDKKKTVVLLGVDDLCVVEMHDILFISNRRESARVKHVVEHLQKYGYERFL